MDGIVEIFHHTDFNGICKKFASEESCLEYLALKKWEGGYICRNCWHNNYCKGNTPYSRRCTRCKREESAKAHTIFHYCRLPLPEAFRFANIVCHNPKISSYELARYFNLRQMTCWKLKKKIVECLESGLKNF
ncbi:MAG TPA: hypothetical protein PLG54_05645 [Bacteroidales bacterium]|jgi:hypothetical protein|nr:hypothetical protein [Bacteroidales bacterium]HOR04981.1 hypothetical protein [Bacteroidales bacterium]HPL34137.1 hypothetical protein [Bacteroidales bacterium]